jgi:hypothetical protein
VFGCVWRQRETLLRLKEGPLLMTGYANSNEKPKLYPPLRVTTVTGKQRPVYGLYAAISRDEGQSWESHKLISDNHAEGHPVQARKKPNQQFKNLVAPFLMQKTNDDLPSQAQDKTQRYPIETKKTLCQHCLRALFFLNVSYVCPEPVLAKRSFIYINGSKNELLAGNGWGSLQHEPNQFGARRLHGSEARGGRNHPRHHIAESFRVQSAVAARALSRCVTRVHAHARSPSDVNVRRGIL